MQDQLKECELTAQAIDSPLWPKVIEASLILVPVGAIFSVVVGDPSLKEALVDGVKCAFSAATAGIIGTRYTTFSDKFNYFKDVNTVPVRVKVELPMILGGIAGYNWL